MDQSVLFFTADMPLPSLISILIINLPLPHPTPILHMITPTNALLIKRPLTRPIRNTDVANLIPNLIPVRTRRRNGRDLAQRPIRTPSNQEAAEEIQVVDVCCALGHRLSDRTHEPDDVDQDPADVGRVAAPVEAEGEVVRGMVLGAV